MQAEICILPTHSITESAGFHQTGSLPPSLAMGLRAFLAMAAQPSARKLAGRAAQRWMGRATYISLVARGCGRYPQAGSFPRSPAMDWWDLPVTAAQRLVAKSKQQH